MSCENCKNDIIKSKTCITPHIMIIFENPILQDVREGIIGTGKRGEILKNLLTANQIPDEFVYITSFIRCRLPRNRPPSKGEFEKCKALLFEEIVTTRPKILVPLGAFPTFAVTNIRDDFKSLAGYWFKTKHGVEIFPTYPMDKLISNLQCKELVFKHFKELRNHLGKYLPQNNSQGRMF